MHLSWIFFFLLRGLREADLCDVALQRCLSILFKDHVDLHLPSSRASPRKIDVENDGMLTYILFASHFWHLDDNALRCDPHKQVRFVHCDVIQGLESTKVKIT